MMITVSSLTVARSSSSRVSRRSVSGGEDGMRIQAERSQAGISGQRPGVTDAEHLALNFFHASEAPVRDRSTTSPVPRATNPRAKSRPSAVSVSCWSKSAATSGDPRAVRMAARSRSVAEPGRRGGIFPADLLLDNFPAGQRPRRFPLSRSRRRSTNRPPTARLRHATRPAATRRRTLHPAPAPCRCGVRWWTLKFDPWSGEASGERGVKLGGCRWQIQSEFARVHESVVVWPRFFQEEAAIRMAKGALPVETKLPITRLSPWPRNSLLAVDSRFDDIHRVRRHSHSKMPG